MIWSSSPKRPSPKWHRRNVPFRVGSDLFSYRSLENHFSDPDLCLLQRCWNCGNGLVKLLRPIYTEASLELPGVILCFIVSGILRRVRFGNSWTHQAVPQPSAGLIMIVNAAIATGPALLGAPRSFVLNLFFINMQGGYKLNLFFKICCQIEAISRCCLIVITSHSSLRYTALPSGVVPKSVGKHSNN